MKRLAAGRIPRAHGLALIRDSDRLKLSRGQPGIAQRRTRDRVRDVPDLRRIVLDPARLREVLLELAVGSTDQLCLLVEHETSGAGRALIDGEDHGSGNLYGGLRPPVCAAAGCRHTGTITGSVPLLSLNDGIGIPQLGFGVFQIPPPDTADAVLHALSSGYRAIDTAAMYRNEAGVAEGIARSELTRGEVFVTTKLWNGDHGRDLALRAFESSLRRLGYDYVDLYLIHWPVPSRDLYTETWRALTELKADGRARSIGVSNFHADHLQRIIAETGVVPTVNQVELHPRLQQAGLRRFHDEHGILTEAWSPLGQGAALRDPVIERIAASLDRTPAQVVLRWHVQLGNVVIPKSVTPERIEQNLRIFDFELDDGQMSAIAQLEEGGRIGPDPATFGDG